MMLPGHVTPLFTSTLGLSSAYFDVTRRVQPSPSKVDDARHIPNGSDDVCLLVLWGGGRRSRGSQCGTRAQAMRQVPRAVRAA